MTSYDPRVQYVVAHFAEPTGLLVSVAGSEMMRPGWYLVERGGEPCRDPNGSTHPPGARFHGPFDTPKEALADALARFP